MVCVVILKYLFIFHKYKLVEEVFSIGFFNLLPYYFWIAMKRSNNVKNLAESLVQHELHFWWYFFKLVQLLSLFFIFSDNFTNKYFCFVSDLRYFFVEHFLDFWFKPIFFIEISNRHVLNFCCETWLNLTVIAIAQFMKLFKIIIPLVLDSSL